MKGKHLCVELYKVANLLPDFEKYGMASQIRNAALSIPSNIAEGHARSSNADFVRFLYHSLGSIRELETILEIALEIGYLPRIDEELTKLDELGKMISSLIHKLSS